MVSKEHGKMIRKRYGRVLGLTLLLLPLLALAGLVRRVESQQNRDRALILAIKRDEASVVARLLQDGADPNAAERTTPALSAWEQAVRLCLAALGERSPLKAPGPSALACAVAVDDVRMARALLRQGAKILPTETVEASSKPWQHDSEILPLLLAAVHSGNAEMVQLLIAHGARLDNRSDRGETALTVAVHASPDAGDEDRIPSSPPMFREADSRPYVTLVRLLLAQGADPNAQTQDSETAITRAAAHNQTEMVADLLARGADPNRGVSNARTALTSATVYGNLPAMQLLLAHGADVAPRGCAAPLTAANDAESVNLLLDHGADVNGRLVQSHEAGDTALICMARRNRLALVRLLVARGADVNAVSGRSRQTALQTAVNAGGIATIRFLLDHGAWVNAANRYGQTALMNAMGADHYDTVQLLLAHGAKTEVHDDTGASVLHYAVTHDNPAVVRLLLARGVRVNSRDRQGRTPLALARKMTTRSSRDIVTLLKKAGGKS
jgi:ankyrin repeat protein